MCQRYSWAAARAALRTHVVWGRYRVKGRALSRRMNAPVSGMVANASIIPTWRKPWGRRWGDRLAQPRPACLQRQAWAWSSRRPCATRSVGSSRRGGHPRVRMKALRSQQRPVSHPPAWRSRRRITLEAPPAMGRVERWVRSGKGTAPMRVYIALPRANTLQRRARRRGRLSSPIASPIDAKRRPVSWAAPVRGRAAPKMGHVEWLDCPSRKQMSD
jgi:hypothetical protein